MSRRSFAVALSGLVLASATVSPMIAEAHASGGGPVIERQH
jgi:hypothetical protein